MRSAGSTAAPGLDSANQKHPAGCPEAERIWSLEEKNQTGHLSRVTLNRLVQISELNINWNFLFEGSNAWPKKQWKSMGL